MCVCVCVCVSGVARMLSKCLSSTRSPIINKSLNSLVDAQTDGHADSWRKAKWKHPDMLYIFIFSFLFCLAVFLFICHCIAPSL